MGVGGECVSWDMQLIELLFQCCMAARIKLPPSHELGHTRVCSGSEISQFMTFFSTNICTVQQLLEDLVQITLHMPVTPTFGGGSQICGQSAPPVKATNGKKLKMLNCKFACISDPTANTMQTAVKRKPIFV